MSKKPYLTLFTLLMATVAPATATPPPPAVDSGPYCGMYCLYAVMNLYGVPGELADLLKPEYIGSAKGSSLAEITIAATDMGLHAAPMVNMTWRTLEASPYPVILHVKGIGSTTYDHFVVFLGTQDGKMKIVDFPNNPEFMDIGALARRWNGTGVILSKEPVHLFRLQFHNAAILATAMLGSLLVVVGVRRASPYFRTISAQPGNIRHWGFSAIQAVCILATAAGLGSFYHRTSQSGLLYSPEVLAHATVENFSHFMTKFDADEVREALARGAMVIDARHSRDFEAGHIEGALQVPPFSSPDQLKELLRNVPSDKEIVVYCQSSGCPYAERIARLLGTIGFGNLAHFKGGWLAWREANGSPPITTRGKELLQ